MFGKLHGIKMPDLKYNFDLTTNVMSFMPFESSQL